MWEYFYNIFNYWRLNAFFPIVICCAIELTACRLVCRIELSLFLTAVFWCFTGGVGTSGDDALSWYLYPYRFSLCFRNIAPPIRWRVSKLMLTKSRSLPVELRLQVSQGGRDRIMLIDLRSVIDSYSIDSFIRRVFCVA